MPSKKRINPGEIITVPNKRKWFSAASNYYATIVTMPTGQSIPLLLTQKEFERLRNRAQKNPEDAPQLNTNK